MKGWPKNRATRKGTLAGTALFFLLLGLLIALPWPLGLNRDWGWSLALGLAALLTFTIAWRRMHDTAIELPFNAVLWVASACLLAMWLLGAAYWLPLPVTDGSTQATRWPLLGAVDPSAAYDAWLKRSLLLLLFAMTIAMVRTRERLRLLLIALIMTGFLQAAYGALMVVSGMEWSFFAKKTQAIGLVSGTYINRNHFSNLAVMSLSVGVGYMITLMLTTRSQASTWKGHLRELIRAVLSEKGRLRLALILLVIAVVMTRSRMGNMSFFISLTVMSALALALLRPITLKVGLFLASVVAIDILIIGQVFGIEQVVDRLQATGQVATEFNPASSDRDRKAVIPIALEMWREKPLFGHGAGGFYTAFAQNRTVDFPGFYDHAHNDYLQFLVEYGLLGTLLILAPILIALVLAIGLLRVRHDPLISGAGFGLAMAIVATLLHSSVEFVQQIPANAATLTVICAAVFAAQRLPKRVSR